MVKHSNEIKIEDRAIKRISKYVFSIVSMKDKYTRFEYFVYIDDEVHRITPHYKDTIRYRYPKNITSKEIENISEEGVSVITKRENSEYRVVEECIQAIHEINIFGSPLGYK